LLLTTLLALSNTLAHPRAAKVFAMTFPLKPLSPVKIAEVRQDYIDGKTIDVIQRERGVSKYKLYQCLKGGPVVDGKRPLEPVPLRGTGTPLSRSIDSEQRAALVRRLWRTAEGRVKEIEARLTLDTLAPAERERDARAMAVLVKTLRDINELDAERDRKTSKRDGNAAATPEENYDDPRQIDEFRRELARRIAAINGGTDSNTDGES
jgi:hypothetical protein